MLWSKDVTFAGDFFPQVQCHLFIYEKHTGQSLSIIEKMMERDYFMSADEAKKTGIVDKVVSERPDFEKNIKKK